MALFVQDPMMNTGYRGIIAAVLDNDSDSDIEASKGRKTALPTQWQQHTN